MQRGLSAKVFVCLYKGDKYWTNVFMYELWYVQQ
jgi:hypothetical protein